MVPNNLVKPVIHSLVLIRDCHVNNHILNKHIQSQIQIHIRIWNTGGLEVRSLPMYG